MGKLTQSFQQFRRNQPKQEALAVNTLGTYEEPDLPSFRAHVGQFCY
jgi:hypothetical protein